MCSTCGGWHDSVRLIKTTKFNHELAREIMNMTRDGSEVCQHGKIRDEWCDACYKLAYSCKINRRDLRAVQQKYNKLVREIEALKTGQVLTQRERGDMIHSAHKLGIFLSDLFGYTDGKPVWTAATENILHDNVGD